jgi:hypothetical protein
MATGILVHPASGRRIQVTVNSKNPFTVQPTWDHPATNKRAGYVNITFQDPTSGRAVPINWLPVNLGESQLLEYVEMSEEDYANLEETGSDPCDALAYSVWSGSGVPR